MDGRSTIANGSYVIRFVIGVSHRTSTKVEKSLLSAMWEEIIVYPFGEDDNCACCF